MSVTARIIQADVLDGLRSLPDASVNCIVTSPPYWSLRDYGVPGQLGLEKTPGEYLARMVAVFREARRVLRADGTLWCNMGDSYAGSGCGWGGGSFSEKAGHHAKIHGSEEHKSKDQTPPPGLKPKDLCGIPWRLALALQADGWYLRCDIIWCLSGGTYVYAQTQKGAAPMMVRELARLDPQTVRLWNGEKWTQLLGISRSARRGTEIEMVLRSGERISCTPVHRFPTDRGLLAASEIRVGDVLRSVALPEPDEPRDCVLDEDAAWFAGLYIAEGSRAGDTIQISGHVKETARLERLRMIAAKFGGSLTVTETGNVQSVRMYGKVLAAILAELVTGRTSRDKGFAPPVWRYSNRFLAAMVDGYLAGDGHYDETNGRWRLGFCRNYNLERDLRTVCARLGYRLVLNLSTVHYHERRFPTFRGELRKESSGHFNKRPLGQVVTLRRARCRNVYDLGVEDEPHVFALASGVLTHNSKPNPMPESVTDRPTRAHEYIFLLSKSRAYYYDAEAIMEPVSPNTHARISQDLANQIGSFRANGGGKTNGPMKAVVRGSTRKMAAVGSGIKHNDSFETAMALTVSKRNKRTIWTIPSAAFKGAHFATFPPALVEPCILAGCPAKCCPVCGAPWERVVEHHNAEIHLSDRAREKRAAGLRTAIHGTQVKPATSTTLGFRPTCDHGGESIPGTVLDPFVGSGTTCAVAKALGRNSIGIELNPKYVAMAERRVARAQYQHALELGA